MLRRTKFWLFLFLTFFSKSLWFSVIPFIAIYFKTLLDISIIDIGWILTTGAIISAITSIYGGSLIDKYGAGYSFQIAMLLIMANIVFAISNNMLMFTAGFVLFAFGEVLVFTLIYVFLDKIAPKKLMATYYGIGNLGMIGFSIGPLLGTFLLQTMGKEILFAMMGIFGTMSLLIFKPINNLVNQGVIKTPATIKT